MIITANISVLNLRNSQPHQLTTKTNDMNIDEILEKTWAKSKQLHVNEYRYSYFNKYYSDMTKEAIKEIVKGIGYGC